MRKILIVGAGQAGLQLGLSLQSEGYDVTIMSARTPQEILGGRVMSTQAMFGPTLRLERDLKLNLWEDRTPQFQAIAVTVADPTGNPVLNFTGPFDEPGQSVDQRVKMAGWLELFESRGGNVVYHTAATSDLEGLTALHDLTIIAAGRGELVELFDRDPSRSPYEVPQRALACVYVHGMTPKSGPMGTQVGINVIPGIAELFTIPAYTTSGPCHIIFWEAVPGGPLEHVWDDNPDPRTHLDRSLDLMRQYAPWEHQRCAAAEPTDARSTLVGRVTPVVRHPVGRLSESAAVLGMADVVVANDPIAGQGANNAARCASIYHQAIVARGDRPFDPAWMQQTFDTYWASAQHSTGFSNMLLAPLPEYVQQVLGAASQIPAVARRFANGYADPSDFQHWITDPDRAAAYLASVSPPAE